MPIRIDRSTRIWEPMGALAPSIWLRSDKGITVATGVSSWADQSGNGNHVVQATSLRQPALVSNAYGNFPGVNFVSTTLSSAKALVSSTTLNQTTDFEMYAVSLTTTAQYAAFGARGGATTIPYSGLFSLGSLSQTQQGIYNGYLWNDKFPRYRLGGTLSYPNAATTLDVPCLNGLYRTGTTALARTDASTLTTGSGYLINGASLTSGVNYWIGNTHETFNAPCMGSVFEVIGFQRILSTSERMTLIRYLSHRYERPWA